MKDKKSSVMAAVNGVLPVKGFGTFRVVLSEEPNSIQHYRPEFELKNPDGTITVYKERVTYERYICHVHVGYGDPIVTWWKVLGEVDE